MTAVIENDVAQVESTERRAVFSALVAFLKGQIVGYATKYGMSHQSSREQTESFRLGFEVGMGGLDVTVRHIIHNRLRHDKPHTESKERDDEILSEFFHWKWQSSSFFDAVRRLFPVDSEHDIAHEMITELLPC